MHAPVSARRSAAHSGETSDVAAVTPRARSRFTWFENVNPSSPAAANDWSASNAAPAWRETTPLPANSLSSRNGREWSAMDGCFHATKARSPERLTSPASTARGPPGRPSSKRSRTSKRVFSTNAYGAPRAASCSPRSLTASRRLQKAENLFCSTRVHRCPVEITDGSHTSRTMSAA